MAAQELAKELSSRIALRSRPVNQNIKAFGKAAGARQPTVCLAGRGNGKRDKTVQLVRAVAAPEKASKVPPPFEAWNTGAAVNKRTDIKTIMILGAGPIVIGQVRAPSVREVLSYWLLLYTNLYCNRSAGLRVRLFRHTGLQGSQVRSPVT